MRVAVIILNWNGAQLLRDFLPALVQHTQDADLIVADNGSTDDSEVVVVQFPDVQWMPLGSNHGFAEGYNKAIACVDHEAVVLLNSDVEVTSGWLAPLVRQLENNRKCAAVMPKILDFKSKGSFEYAGAAGGYLDHYGFAYCRGRLFDELEEDDGQYDLPIQVDWTSGACMLVRRELYDKLGGLDASFFAHFEEIDLCWRLRNAGYYLVCEPASHIYHVGGATLEQGSTRKVFLNFRNALSTLYLNAQEMLVLRLFVKMSLDGLAAYSFLFSGRFSYFWAVARAHFAFYGNLGALSRKRTYNKRRWTTDFKETSNLHVTGTSHYSSLQEHRKVSSIVWSHYVRGIKRWSELHK